MFGKITESKIDKWAEKKKYMKIIGALEEKDVVDHCKAVLKETCPDSAEALAEGVLAKKPDIQTACRETISELAQEHGDVLIFEVSKNAIYNGLSLKEAFESVNDGEKTYQKRMGEIRSILNGITFGITGQISSYLRKLMVPSEKVFSDSIIFVDEDFDTGEEFATIEPDDFKSYVCDIVRPVVELSLPFGIDQKAAQEVLDLCDFAYGAVLRSFAKISKKIKGAIGLADKGKFEDFTEAAIIIEHVIDVRNQFIAKPLKDKFGSLSITQWSSDYISYESSEFLGAGKVSWSPTFEAAVELSKVYSEIIPLDTLQ